MAEENNQKKNAVCAVVQPAAWKETDLIIRHIATFLGPTDLCSFRLVCRKWKDDSAPIWKYHRTRHILRRYSELALKSFEAFNDPERKVEVLLKPLKVFSEYRPPEMECNFDCVWAEELRDFFSRAEEDDAKLKNTSFLFIILMQWNRFGNSSGEQEGAKWLLNEVADKVVHLTLYKCNLFISQGEFFPTFCRMTQLKELMIRGTCFQLRPSVPVEPTLAETSPLPNLKVVQMIYENCAENRMANYTFPWEIFLGAIPELGLLAFSFSNWSSLKFAIHQFFKMIMVPKSLKAIVFKNLLKPNQEPIMPKTKVMEVVQESFQKLGFGSPTLQLQSLQQFLPQTQTLPFSSYYFRSFLVVLPTTRLHLIKFEDHEDGPTGINPEFSRELLLQELERIQNEIGI